ncbi:hypothetical protein LTR28_004079 [Elasticomyces elasticus]|nr:hypothetical protein LTR28_004079 [Elasticomyces elasticus]
MPESLTGNAEVDASSRTRGCEEARLVVEVLASRLAGTRTGRTAGMYGKVDVVVYVEATVLAEDDRADGTVNRTLEDEFEKSLLSLGWKESAVCGQGHDYSAHRDEGWHIAR